MTRISIRKNKRNPAVATTNRITGFPPIVNERCTVLILGTLPGTKAIQKQESYGNIHNHFWPIMMKLLKGNLKWDYSRRLHWLLKHKIALWDVYESGFRDGAADSTIKEPKLNNFEAFFKIYPSVEHIFCNGKESFGTFVNRFGHLKKEIHYLPSTSPALAKSLEWKLKHWAAVLLP